MSRPVALAVAAAAALTLCAAPATASAAKRKTCSGSVTFSGTPTRVVVYRGVSCTKAKSVLRAYDKGNAPSPWVCVLAHAPFTKIDGRIVGVSCGYGGSSSNVRSRTHAFVGTIRGG